MTYQLQSLTPPQIARLDEVPIARQEKAHCREYLKWAHQKTAERWEGYEGKKTYAQVFRETLSALRSGSR